MTPDERDHQVRRLTACADWPALWQLARQLPLADVAAMMRLFGDGWRPADAAGRRLFERLTDVRPETIIAAAAEPVWRIQSRHGNGGTIIRFAPDESHVAVVTRQGLDVHALQAGHPVEHYDTPSMRYLCGAAILSGGAVWIASDGATWHIGKQRRRQPPEILSTGHQLPLPLMDSQPDQFIVGERIYSRVWYEIAAGRRPGKASPQELRLERGSHLWLGTMAKRGLREVSLRDLGLERGRDRILTLAAEPVTGHLAIVTEVTEGNASDLTILDEDLRIIGQARDFGTIYQPGAYFCGPDRLITRGYYEVRSWRVGPSLAEEAVRPGATDWGTTLPWLGLTAVKYLQELTWLDARTLTPVDGLPGLQTAFIAAPSGRRAATVRVVPDEFVIEVHDLQFASLVTGPLADARPADLTTVRAAEASDAAPEVKQVAGLLREYLEYRFGCGS